MKYLRILFIAFPIILYSCSAEDTIQTNGENSFFAKLGEQKIVAKNIHKFPSGTSYGLKAHIVENSWSIKVKNGSSQNFYIYINEVTERGNYLLKDPDTNFPDQLPNEVPTSVIIGDGSLNVLYLTKGLQSNEYIKITKIQGDSIIIGEFDKITLTDPENSNNKTILTNGKFNINRNTLNQLEP